MTGLDIVTAGASARATVGTGPGLSAGTVVELLREATRDVANVRDPYPLGPVALDPVAYAELFSAARGLLALLRRAVLSAAPDVAGRVAALGAKAADYPLTFAHLPTEERFCDVMARPDIIIGPDGPRFLEFNVSGAFGGVPETHVLTRLWRRVHGSRYRGGDPFAARAAFFARVVREQDLAPAVVLAGSARDLPTAESARYYELEAGYLRSRGFAAAFFEPEDLVSGLAAPAGIAYPTGLRAFAVADWRREGIDLAPVRRALDLGCLLLPSQTGAMLANKKVLAWLSEHPPWMSRSECGLVERYLPWTRIVAQRDVSWRGHRWDLPELVTRRQALFVLKKAIGSMGTGVLLGRNTPPATWRAAVDAAVLAGDSVVQEHVPSRTFPLETTDGMAEAAPVFSPILIGGRAGGVWLRHLPPGRDGVINVNGFGAVENVALVGC